MEYSRNSNGDYIIPKSIPWTQEELDRWRLEDEAEEAVKKPCEVIRVDFVNKRRSN